MKTSLIILALFCLAGSYSQENPLHKILESFHLQNANDSDGLIDIGMVYSVKLNSSPKGAGDIQEVSGRVGLFPQEKNVAWLKFRTLQSGVMTIKILPDSANNDYDFLLFSFPENETLDGISNKTQKPIRSNCARTQNINEGKTGLSYQSGEKNHVGQGTGASFSNSLEVKRGETYILVLNNVTDDGSGVQVFFDYWKSKKISGIVKDEKEKPIKTDIIWEDRASGEILAQTESDSLNGKFLIEVPYNTSTPEGFSLIAFSDTKIFDQKDFEGSEVSAYSGQPISMVLKELKGGGRMNFGTINFVANQANFLSSAYPSLKRLYKLMKKNTEMKIEISGHTHGNNDITQQLSEKRAEAVKDYLIDHGIKEDRLTTVGYGGKFMLYAEDSGEKLASKNRRVEVLVLSF